MKTKWMRKVLAGALSAALCCGMLTGCGEGVEQTNKELNLSLTERMEVYISYPLQLYRNKHPEVTVNTTVIHDEDLGQYFDALKASLMTGKSIPDLVLIDSTMMQYCDIYKMEQAGGFIDLNTLFAEDQRFDASLYNTGVIEGLQYDGKQYVYPIAYNLPCYMSTEEKLAQLDITPEEFQSMDVLEFFQMLERVREEYGYRVDELIGGMMFHARRCPTEVYLQWYCPDTVDYPNHSLSMDNDGIEALVAAMADYRSQQEGDDFFGDMRKPFYSVTSLNENSMMYCKQAKFDDETPVMTCLRDKYGNINANVWLAAAIPQLSPNQQNAYEFLKQILAEEVMNMSWRAELGIEYARPTIPVLLHAQERWAFGLEQWEGTLPTYRTFKSYEDNISGSFLRSEWAGLIMDEAKSYYDLDSDLSYTVRGAEQKLKIYVSE